MSMATETSHPSLDHGLPPSAPDQDQVTSVFEDSGRRLWRISGAFPIWNQALSANVREKLAPHSRVCFFRTSLVGSRSVVTKFPRER